MQLKAAFLTASVAIAAACGGTPQPGDPGYEFNLNGEYAVEFSADDGQSYAGTMQLTTAPGGAVTGTMSLVSPLSVDGTAEGMIVGAQLELDVEYFIPDNQCGGRAVSSAVIEQGGNMATGTSDISSDDNCAGGPTTAAFTLSR
ncbi:MAG: hypothetical protein ACC682_16445 [Gemmatimonadota bacterium]